jgi:predicted DNA binding CopG/RHH family protein
MPHKSSAATKKPSFKNEAEEADWYHTPEGQRSVLRSFRSAMRKGVIQSEARTFDELRTALKKAGPGGAAQAKNLKVKRTDPAVLEALMEKARASMTQAVSLRIPVTDLDAAKRIAEKKGVGYQSVLKQAIRDGLRQT